MSRRNAVYIALMLLLAASAGQVSAQGEPVTEPSGLTVIGTPEAPAPLVGRPAPNLSVEQMASQLCANQIDNQYSQSTVRAAYDATVRARQVRIDGAGGQATDAQMREAEIARQTAVNRLGPYERASDFPDKRRDLKIDFVSYRRVNENGRNVLEVNFIVHNLTGAQVELPPVTLLSIDFQGFVLAGQSAPLSDLFIGARGSKAFALRFHNPPTYTRSILPRFAPPLATRGNRGCDYFDPLAGTVAGPTPVSTGPAPVPVPEVGRPTPRYSLGDLATMQTWARYESREAFEKPAEFAVCDGLGHRRWHDLMSVADHLDQAWDATGAAEELRRDAATGVFEQDDVNAGELARQAAVASFLNARTWKPAAAPPAYVSLLGYYAAVQTGKDQFTVIFNGSVNNPNTPALRLAAVDPYGYVLAENFRDKVPRLLAPQGSGPNVDPDGVRQPYVALIKAPAALVTDIRIDFPCVSLDTPGTPAVPNARNGNLPAAVQSRNIRQIVQSGGTASEVATAALSNLKTRPGPGGRFDIDLSRIAFNSERFERTPGGQVILVMERTNGGVLVLAGADLQGYKPAGGIASLPLAIYPFRGA